MYFNSKESWKMVRYIYCGYGNTISRGCNVYNELKNNNIIIDLEILVKEAKDFDNDLTCYAELMKQRILSVTGNN